MVQQIAGEPNMLASSNGDIIIVGNLRRLWLHKVEQADLHLACLSLQLALVELQTLVLPSIESIKSRLEQRYTLERGPTPLERLDFITNISR